MLLAADNLAALGGLGLAAAALITAVWGVLRGRGDSEREDLETVVASFKGLIEAERVTTDRQLAFANTRITGLEGDVIRLQQLHEDCEKDRRDLMARLGLG